MITLNSTKTKKQRKEASKKLRVFVPMNTGTRTHKSAKDYHRKKHWAPTDE